MHLLFLNTDIDYSGASKMLVWVANQCVEYGFKVTILTYRRGIKDQNLNSQIQQINEQWEEQGGKINIIHTIYKIRHFIIKGRYDVCIAFLSPSILRVAIATIGVRTKLIFSHRSDPYHNSIRSKGVKKTIIYKLNEWAFSKADGYVFQTEAARAFFNRKIQSNSVIIPNAVPVLKRTVPRYGNIRRKVVTVGRLDIKQKRQDLLIKAFNIVSRKYPDYILEIYGDGNDLNLIQVLAASNPHIYLMGKTDNVVEAIQNAAIFVLSSDYEGIPNALLEAMSLGVPCISTDCSPGGASILINNQENGLLVTCDDAQALSKAMVYYIEHPEDAELQAKRAMKVNTIFSEENITKQWVDFIIEVYKR